MASNTADQPVGPAMATPAAGQKQLRADDASSIDDGVHKKDDMVVLTKRQRLERHFRRRWWWYLIGLVVFLAIMLPIL